MNLLIFCALFCFPPTLAFQVSFYETNPTELTSILIQAKKVPSLVCTPHEFMYQRGDSFSIYLELWNYTSAVTGALAVVSKPPGTMRYSYVFTKPGWLELELTTEQTTIDVELLTDDGCLRETIFNGTAMPKTAPVKDLKHDDICLNQKKCVAFVNAGRVCRDMKPQPCVVTDNTKPLVSKGAPLDNRQESLNEIYKTTTTTTTKTTTTVLPAMDTSNSLTPAQNISSATDNSTGAPTSPSRFSVIILIVSVTAAFALTSLLVISLWHFGRKTYNSPGLPQILPANVHRYYENVVFRDGCQQEIEQLEQRATSEHHYEEINDY